MIDEADPADRMLEEHIHPLLEGLASPLVEDVLGLEGLVYWKVYGVVRVRDTRRRRGRSLLVFLVLRFRVRCLGRLVVSWPALLHRSGYALVVCLAVSRHAAL